MLFHTSSSWGPALQLWHPPWQLQRQWPLWHRCRCSRQLQKQRPQRTILEWRCLFGDGFIIFPWWRFPYGNKFLCDYMYVTLHTTYVSVIFSHILYQLQTCWQRPEGCRRWRQVKDTSGVTPSSDEERRVLDVVKKRAGVYKDKAAHPEFASVVLLTAANYAYFSIYNNWRCNAERHGLDWAVIANDDKAFEELGPDRGLLAIGEKVSGMNGWGSAKLDSVGRNKMFMVLTIMRIADLGVVFTDADNMFLGDPFAQGVHLGDLIRSGKYDYVYQEELAKAPAKDHVVRGDGGNTGFFYATPRNNKKMISFFTDVVAEVDRQREDAFRKSGERLGADPANAWVLISLSSGKSCRSCEAHRAKLGQEDSNVCDSANIIPPAKLLQKKPWIIVRWIHFCIQQDGKSHLVAWSRIMPTMLPTRRRLTSWRKLGFGMRGQLRRRSVSWLGIPSNCHSCGMLWVFLWVHSEEACDPEQTEISVSWYL